MGMSFLVDGKSVLEDAECVCVGEDIAAAPRCGFCGGSGRHKVRRHEHEVNLSDGTARAIIAAAGILGLGGPVGEHAGEISGERLERLARSLTRLANLEGRRRGHLTETTTGANWVDVGLDDDHLRDVATRLLAVCHAAIAEGLSLRYG